MFKIKLLFLYLLSTIIGNDGEVLTTVVSRNYQHKEPFKIGMLISDKEALAAKQGAEFAILKANEKAGSSGNQFQLKVRSTEGPWGAGSKESVNLVFEDEVLSIIGSLDGRNAHLAEQVAAKTKIAFLSTRATEMSLSQAFVPWFFRCIPDDNQQAKLLTNEIFVKRKLNNVAIIYTDDYDSEKAVNSFIKVIDAKNITRPKLIEHKESNETILTEIKKNNIKNIVLFGDREFALKLIPVIKQQNIVQNIFGPLSVMYDKKAVETTWEVFENVILVSPGYWFTDSGINFQKEFYKTYGYKPGIAAAYAFDCTNITIEAIKKAGHDRNKIIEELVKINFKNGITGNIKFGTDGNRVGNDGLIIVKNGTPVKIQK